MRIAEPKRFGRRLKQHRQFTKRSEFFLTLDITPAMTGKRQ
jgi:hypothetical protein